MGTALQVILHRRAEVDRLIADYTRKIDELRREIPELEIAERVYRRLQGGVAELDQETQDLLDESPKQVKPAGTPTMPEMIHQAVLLQSMTDGHGLEPRDIMKCIAETWWPEVRAESVGPIAWRMWKQGRLSKVGSRYFPPKESDPAQSKSGEAAEQGHVRSPREAGAGGGT